jgi:hypothetical protein
MAVKRYAEIIITVSAPVSEKADLSDIARHVENDLRTKVRTKTKAKVADVHSRQSVRYWKQDD